MPDVTVLSLLAAIVLLAFVAKGAAGFGEGLIMMPLFVLLVDIRLALVLGLVTSHGADWALLARHWKAAARTHLPWMVAAAMAGVGVGTSLGRVLPTAAWERGLGMVVLVFALRLLLLNRRAETTHAPLRILGVISGALAGVLDALFGTGGPPVIVYFTWLGLRPAAFRATFVMTAAFGLHIPRFIAYAASGLLGGGAMLTALALLPAMLLGTWIGARIHPHINDRTFRKVAAAVLLVVGLKLTL